MLEVQLRFHGARKSDTSDFCCACRVGEQTHAPFFLQSKLPNLKNTQRHALEFLAKLLVCLLRRKGEMILSFSVQNLTSLLLKTCR